MNVNIIMKYEVSYKLKLRLLFGCLGYIVSLVMASQSHEDVSSVTECLGLAIDFSSLFAGSRGLVDTDDI